MRIGALGLLLLVMACRSQVQLEKIMLQPQVVSTAGGTWVTVGNLPFALKDPRVEIGLLDKSGTVIDWFPSEGEKIMGSHTLMFQTTQFLEECGQVRVTDRGRETILPQALCFHALAFTANQSAHTMSVVDTVENELFGPKESMASGATAAPISLAYNVSWRPGRTLYTLDGASGDMECHDASNFVPLDIDGETSGVQNVLVLQDPQTTPATATAFDLGFYYFGDRTLITHVTAGTDTGTNPTPGGLSLVWIIGDEAHIPILMDVDGNVQTTSPGAPDGVTRATLCVGDPPDCETGTNDYFYPLSIKIVNLATDAAHAFEEGEAYPGEYAFISGVGYKVDEYTDRDAMAAVLDLNHYLYCDPSLHRPNYCMNLDRFNCSLSGNYCNPRYWGTLQAEEGYANFKTLEAGTDPSAAPGDTKHAMDFVADSWLDTTDLGPTLYLANQDEGAVYLFQYDDVNWDWVPVLDQYDDPVTIATGISPSGVKVESPDPYTTYVYITNAGDDTVTVVDTATNEEVPDDSPIYQDYSSGGCVDRDHLPVAMDARSTGEWGYSVDKDSGTVSVYDLPNTQMAQGGVSCEISTGSGSEPVDIVVQPVPEEEELFGQMMGMLVAAAPADYDAPEDREEIIGDWKAIRQLVLTPAAPQAILAALEAYLHKLDQKVCKEKLKKHMKQAAKLYRAIYRHHHPGN